LASVFALLAIGIGIATGQRLLPLLVSVFVASFLFSASCAFLVVEQQRYAQAIAIQFGPKANAEKGITGVYVTATEKTIFYGRPDLDGAADVGLYEVPRAETTTYAVGRLEPIVEDNTHPVQDSAEALLKSLKVDAESLPASEVPPTTTPTPTPAPGK